MPRVPQRIQNSSCFKTRRQKLRRHPTAAEDFLWKFLRKRRMLGWKFRRQYSIESFILDFYCPQCMLGIELDGAGHYTVLGGEYDAMRDQKLKKLGIQILRFENRDVFEHLDEVLETIREALEERKPVW